MQHRHGIAAPARCRWHCAHNIDKATRNLRANVAVASLGAGCKRCGLELSKCVHESIMVSLNTLCKLFLSGTTMWRMEQPKKRGRPPKEPGEKLERMVLFVPQAVRLKVERCGQEWARAVLRRAKEPAR